MLLLQQNLEARVGIGQFRGSMRELFLGILSGGGTGPNDSTPRYLLRAPTASVRLRTIRPKPQPKARSSLFVRHQQLDLRFRNVTSLCQSMVPRLKSGCVLRVRNPLAGTFVVFAGFRVTEENSHFERGIVWHWGRSVANRWDHGCQVNTPLHRPPSEVTVRSDPLRGVQRSWFWRYLSCPDACDEAPFHLGQRRRCGGDRRGVRSASHKLFISTRR